MKTVAIIQSRLGSTRLPNKMMLHLHGYPVVEWVYRRVSQSKKLDKVVFAIPDTPVDQVLGFYLEKLGASVFRGSENDVVERYAGAARSVEADAVVRVCGDNPLICASEIDRLVSHFETARPDYAYNHIPRGNRYPDGLGAEICSMQVLERIARETTLADHREHLFNYLWANREQFQIETFEPPEAISHPELKLDLDTPEDYLKLMGLQIDIEMTAEQVVKACLPSNK